MSDGPDAGARVWVLGHCWRCDSEGVPVLWLGPVQSQDKGDAPFQACRPCVERLEELIELHHARG
ncbi:hypothetical protein [Streptomyces sp. NPDC057250]|uniref:hypothetical protein n=1 Tax=Streptomyces sp. NPDC057250 TaxID=3346068 RepID=UPI00363CACA4